MHTNPDLLALLALGEDVGAEEALVHISECPACRDELAALTAAASTGRRTNDRDVLLSPRPEGGQGITQELPLQAPGPPAEAGPPAAIPSSPAPPTAGDPSRTQRRTR